MKGFLFIFVVLYMVTLNECEMEPFIVDGLLAKIENFPYSAFLAVDCNAGKDIVSISWICGSSILNEYVTLTAGHCLYGCYKTTAITISVGHEHIRKGKVTRAYGFSVHKRYDEISVANDIALVRLKTALTFSNKVSQVTVMAFPPYTEEALVAGWGVTDERLGKYSETLKWTKQQIWSLQKCQQILGPIPDGTFCAFNNGCPSYVHIGDSGSALVVQGNIQLGIVSYTIRNSDGVGVYTDTGHFFNWIRINIEKIMNA